METISGRLGAMLAAAWLVAAPVACGSSVSPGEDGEDAPADATGDAAGDDADGPDTAGPDDTAASDDTAATDDAGRTDEASTDHGREDATADDGALRPDIVGLEPEGIETYVPAAGGEGIRPHRHALPAALGDGVYALVVDVDPTGAGSPLTLGAYWFDPRGLELRQVWLDDSDATSDYNSVCWTGEAFVAALPTSRVGLRVLALGPDGTMLHEPAVLEPDAAYSPAGAGQPPVVLCSDDGPFVIDHGRGAGGTDRLYALEPDGAYSETFVDVDLPAFSTTTFDASSPCATVGVEVACATTSGLVFVRRDGSSRVSESLPSPGICPPGTGCDVAPTGDGIAAVWSALAGDRLALAFARFGLDGTVPVPLVLGPSLQPMANVGVRTAASGWTVLASGPGADVDPLGPVQLYLFDTAGVQLGPSLTAGVCNDGPEPPGPDCPFPMGGSATTPLFWEGDAYAALWVPEGPWSVANLAYRRFRLVER